MGLGVCQSYVRGGGLLQGVVDVCAAMEQRRLDLSNA